MSLQRNIRDLIFFYVKTNYNEYLKENKIKIIEEDKIDDDEFLVTKGDIVLIPDGAFHKVWNTSIYKANNPLIFVCVFDGGRNH